MHCALPPYFQVLDLSQESLGLSAEQLQPFTRFYSAVPELQLSRLLMDWEDVQGCMEEAPEGLSFKNLLALETSPAGTAGTQVRNSAEDLLQLQHPAAVKAMVAKLFAGLQR
jgi:hypothetical protein